MGRPVQPAHAGRDGPSWLPAGGAHRLSSAVPRAGELERLVAALAAGGGAGADLRPLAEGAVTSWSPRPSGAEPGPHCWPRWPGRPGIRCSSPSYSGRRRRNARPQVVGGRAEDSAAGPAADAAADDPAPAELPARGHTGGPALGLHPGFSFHVTELCGDHGAARLGAVSRRARGGDGAGPGGGRDPPEVPPRPDPRRDLRGPAAKRAPGLHREAGQRLAGAGRGGAAGGRAADPRRRSRAMPRRSAG